MYRYLLSAREGSLAVVTLSGDPDDADSHVTGLINLVSLMRSQLPGVTLQETGLASALPYALVLLVVALPLPLAAFTWSARARRRRRG